MPIGFSFILVFNCFFNERFTILAQKLQTVQNPNTFKNYEQNTIPIWQNTDNSISQKNKISNEEYEYKTKTILKQYFIEQPILIFDLLADLHYISRFTLYITFKWKLIY